ncbi:MAG: 3-phosphoshikimate 1-carboxyvinyltransferase [Chitinophagales bacterium]|nr:MAG: 3-phosphoshikimate 1-carboxyvinyltransferase [Chitinophagales bacterium]
MRYLIHKNDKSLTGEINLDGCTEITNRLLIIKALTSGFFDLKNYSCSEESQRLLNLINSNDKVLNANDSGSSLRYLLAFLAMHEGEIVLTASDRLLDYPIEPLVSALHTLGADIRYIGKKHYPPVYIRGKMLKGKLIDLDTTLSSHFATALILIAPLLRNGLIIRMKGNNLHRSEIELTLHILRHFGIRYEWSQNMISIARQDYEPHPYTVEASWKCASFFYQLATLSDHVDIRLNGLHRISLQSDAAIVKIMEQFGVATTFTENGIRITKKQAVRPRVFEYNFQQCPELAPMMLVTCAALNLPARFSGVPYFKNYGFDSMSLVQNELSLLGAEVHRDDLRITLSSADGIRTSDIVLKTHNDYRVSLALLPLVMLQGELLLDDAEIIKSSFPLLWQQLPQLGLKAEPLEEIAYHTL